MKQSKKTDSVWRSAIVIASSGFTAVWLLSLAWIVGIPASCPGTEAAPLWQAWVWFKSCREASAIGDFLAGAFAPVAFLWLVAAVFVQSKELQAQRHELSLTREEYKESRKTAEATRVEIAAQVEVARQSAQFMEKQTEILGAQLAREDRVNLEETFQAEIDALTEHIEGNLNSATYILNGRELVILRLRADVNWGTTAMLKRLKTSIDGVIRELEKPHAKGDVIDVTRSDLVLAVRMLSDLDSLVQNGHRALRHRSMSFNLTALQSSLERMLLLTKRPEVVAETSSGLN